MMTLIFNSLAVPSSCNRVTEVSYDTPYLPPVWFLRRKRFLTNTASLARNRVVLIFETFLVDNIRILTGS